jgi:sulfatase modifying factor 1
MNPTALLRAACILFLGVFSLHAGVPSLINYQGRLTDAQGNPVTGNCTMVVRIYDAPTGGNMTYEETIGTVALANGTYSFRFGLAGSGIVGILTGNDYLALSVNGSEESTRTRLLAVPYALKAKESADAQALVAQSKLLTLSGDLNFGNTTVGGGIQRALSITNEGFLKVQVIGISYPAGFSGSWSGTIAPGDTQDVTVMFSPTAVQSYRGNLVVSSDATGVSGDLAVSGGGIASVLPNTNMIMVQGGTLLTSNALSGTFVSSFQIGKYEVTWGEWQEVRAWAMINGYSDLANVGGGSAGDHPVRNVSWYDVVKWTNARSEREGLVPVYSVNGTIYRSGEFGWDSKVVMRNLNANGYRLPSDAEWEWAARGGVSHQGYIYSGSNDANAVAWTRENSIGAAVNLQDGRGTWPVGQKAANELGIFDMSGNVMEWCEDIVYGSERRIRGDSWSGGGIPVYARVIYRIADSRIYNDTGFRLARNSGL